MTAATPGFRCVGHRREQTFSGDTRRRSTSRSVFTVGDCGTTIGYGRIPTGVVDTLVRGTSVAVITFGVGVTTFRIGWVFTFVGCLITNVECAWVFVATLGIGNTTVIQQIVAACIV